LDLSLHLEAVTSSACLLLLGKEFHTIGPLTQNAFADKVNGNGETVSNTHTHTHTTVLRPFFWDHPGEPVEEQ